MPLALSSSSHTFSADRLVSFWFVKVNVSVLPSLDSALSEPIWR